MLQASDSYSDDQIAFQKKKNSDDQINMVIFCTV